MPGQYALIQDGVVISCIVWDGPEESPMTFDEGVTFNMIADSLEGYPAPGWLFDGKSFSPPKLTNKEKSLQKDESIANNLSYKSYLLSIATQKISTSQTKLLLGRKLDDDETFELNSWVDYIDSLNAIDANTSSEISWPSLPL